MGFSTLLSFPCVSAVKNLPAKKKKKKNPPAKQERQVRILGREDLGEGNVTYSSILAWKIPCTEEPGGL